MLLSMISLLYGSYGLHSSLIVIFFILSVSVVISYWSWYFYVNIITSNYPVFEEKVLINFLKSDLKLMQTFNIFCLPNNSGKPDVPDTLKLYFDDLDKELKFLLQVSKTLTLILPPVVGLCVVK